MNELKARWIKHTLDFRFLAKTSRDELRQRATWFIILSSAGGKVGIGECAMLKGLSIDDVPEFEEKLGHVCEHVESYADQLVGLSNFPSIRFGLETALLGLKSSSPFELFNTPFLKGDYAIPINGLVWMGELEFMSKQVKEKIEAGFDCIKLKIGALKWKDELTVLQSIRKDFQRKDLEIRVDANGAFQFNNVMPVLESLSELNIHSIEQPIRAGQLEDMAELCSKSPVPIAFDEELIPCTSSEMRRALLDQCQPQYLVLKPSLLGGYEACNEWISLAHEFGCDYWVTSALESNIGLNAIAQWVSSLKPSHKYQGLGTGKLYHNNFESPLEVSKGQLLYLPEKAWELKGLLE